MHVALGRETLNLFWRSLKHRHAISPHCGVINCVTKRLASRHDVIRHLECIISHDMVVQHESLVDGRDHFVSFRTEKSLRVIFNVHLKPGGSVSQLKGKALATTISMNMVVQHESLLDGRDHFVRFRTENLSV